MSVRKEFLLPDLGEGLTESDLVKWHVQAGDRVELNQVIAEVETAKALVDIPSPFAGVVASLHAEPGQTVEVGEPLVTFELSDDAGAPSGRDAAPAGRAAAAATTAGGTGEDGAGDDGAVATLTDTAASPDTTADTDDAAQPNLVGYGARPARSGRPARRPRRYATATASATTSSVPAVERPAQAPAGDPRAERARSTPGVRAFARRLGVELAGIVGTGPNGRITREDVEAARNGAPAAAAPRATVAPAPTGAETRSPVRGVRKHTAAAMVSSAFTAPQASLFLSVDVTPSMELLARLKTHPMARGTRITVLALVARAVCALLPSHPALTSRWEDLPDGSAEIVRPAHVNLGIAVATDRGLVVPHIPAADTMSLTQLASALGELTETARAGRTAPERLTGGTLTITNIGVFGVDGGTPILNPGEPAILGVGTVRRQPWEYQGEIALRQVMSLSMTFDHRVVDGEQGARFLADLGAVLADPALALLLGGTSTTGDEPA